MIIFAMDAVKQRNTDRINGNHFLCLIRSLFKSFTFNTEMQTHNNNTNASMLKYYENLTRYALMVLVDIRIQDKVLKFLKNPFLINKCTPLESNQQQVTLFISCDFSVSSKLLGNCIFVVSRTILTSVHQKSKLMTWQDVK